MGRKVDVAVLRPTRARAPHGETPPLFEPIEPRLLLTAFTVDSLADAVAADGQVTLREALQAANTDAPVHDAPAGSGADRIEFHGDLFLSGPRVLTLGGQPLRISDALVLVGPGADLLTIDADGRSCVVEVQAAVTADLSGLTVSGGSDSGIRNAGVLSLTAVGVAGNAAPFDGGGIHNAAGAQLTLRDSAVWNNAAGFFGGGLVNWGLATVANSTISTNESDAHGGGVVNWGDLSAVNVTVTLNTADADGVAPGLGGGVFCGAGATTTLQNTIVAGNLAGATAGDVSGAFEQAGHHNLIGVLDGSTGLDDVTSLHGSVAAPLDPGLGPLADNGGPTPTHRLLPGSPAFDVGDNAVATAAGLTGDQRGAAYDRILYDTVDIGAVESTRGATLGGVVWRDVNVDGVPDPDEPRLDGVVVRLYLDDGDGTFEPATDDALTQTKSTAGGGEYRFLELDPGDYWVEVDEASPVLGGMTRTTASDPLMQAVALGAAYDGADFGYANTLLTVTTLADELDAVPSEGTGLSLREAVARAAVLGGEDAYVITFDPSLFAGGPGTILLDPALGQIDLDVDLDIRGPGADTLSVQSQDDVRAFQVTGNATVFVSGMTITGGDAPPESGTRGRGVQVIAGCAVTFAQVTFTHCVGNGSAIYGDRGDSKDCVITITDCRFEGNTASGGGYVVRTGAYSETIIRGSSFVGNGNSESAGPVLYVGAFAYLAIADCTLASNVAQSTYQWSVAIQTSTASVLDAANVTISGNSGGTAAVYGHVTHGTAFLADVTFRNCTIADNDTPGISVESGYRRVLLHNCIVSGNTLPGGGRSDIVGSVSTNSSYNIIGSGGNLTDGIKSNRMDVEPLIGPLADNGGAVQTHALLPGSPAINGADGVEAIDAEGNPLSTDGRGEGFARVVDGAVDIGAFEAQDATGTISGVVWDDADEDGQQDAGEQPLFGAALAIHADDGDGLFDCGVADERLVVTETDVNGNYTVVGLPAGAYWVCLDPRSGKQGYRGVTNGEPAVLVNLAYDEDRENVSFGTMPAAVFVTALNDEAVDTDGELSLREAVLVAGQATGRPNTIEFAPALFAEGGGTISVDPALGHIELASDLSIIGPGADVLTVDGGSNVRTFRVTSGAEASISRMTIYRGRDTRAGQGGGGVEVLGGCTVTVTDVVFTRCYSLAGGSIITRDGAYATVVRCRFEGSKSIRCGDAVYVDSRSEMVIRDSTFVGNGDTTNGGAAIRVGDASKATIVNCTITDNQGWDSGGIPGGLQTDTSAMVFVINTTISGNRGGGGGVRGALTLLPSNTGAVILRNCTIVDNQNADIYIEPDYKWIILRNCIVSTVTGTLHSSSSHNLIGGNPMLGPLADNGGVVQTHELLPLSPAINGGSDSDAVDSSGEPLLWDARGEGFGRFVDDAVDIGAYEVQWLPGLISGRVWDDDDADGEVDPEETVFAGVGIGLYLDDGDGVFDGGIADVHLTDRTTDEQGAYEITGLGPGTYWIDVDHDAGPLAERIVNHYYGSDPLPVTLAVDEDRTDADVGFVLPAMIGGVVWNDANEDAELDADEGGIEAVTVNLYRDDGDGEFEPGGDDALERTQLTAGDGGYDFADLVAGAFWIEIDEASPALADATRTSPFSHLLVQIAAEETHAGADFGYLRPIVVTALNDETSATDTDGLTSLREALGIADGRAGADVILFDAALFNGGPGTIALTLGQLAPTTDVDIRGPGAEQLILDAEHNSRVFDFNGAITAALSGLTIRQGQQAGTQSGGGVYVSADSALTLCGVSFVECIGASGGAVFVESSGSVFVTRCLFVSNHSVSGIQDSGGGAIYVAGGGQATIRQSSFVGNTALIGGGAIGGWMHARIDIIDTTVSGNSASQRGGGIELMGVTASIVNTTISGNEAALYAGGLLARDLRVDVTLRNCTIADNQTDGEGGGVLFSDGACRLHNTLIATNRGDAATLPDDFEIHGDVDPTSSYNYIGACSLSPALADGVNGNHVGTPEEPLDAALGPLADNGGPTWTHALVPGSRAINTGNNDQARNEAGNPLASDQRGDGFDRVCDGVVDIGAYEAQWRSGSISGIVWDDADLDGEGDAAEPPMPGSAVAIYADDGDGLFAPQAGDTLLTSAAVGEDGAYRFGGLPAGSYWIELDETSGGHGNRIVTTGSNPVRVDLAEDENREGVGIGSGPMVLLVTALNDEAVDTDGEISLREAIAQAERAPGLDVIEFDSGLFAGGLGTVTLEPSLGHLEIRDDMELRGPGMDLLAVSGGEETRVFAVLEGAAVCILDLTITRGHMEGAGDCGGGVYVAARGSLALSAVTVSHCQAGTGAGIGNRGGDVSAVDCVIRNNWAHSGQGGGIGTWDDGHVVVSGSVFYSNVAGSSGGAVGAWSSGSTAVVRDCLIHECWSHSVGGGGLSFACAQATVVNTTIRSNHASRYGGGIHAEGPKGSVTVRNCTIVDNDSGWHESPGDSWKGGGIYSGNEAVVAHNTIIARNLADTFTQLSDVYGSFRSSSSCNLVATGEGSSGLRHGENGNLVGTKSQPLDPMIAPLADNGGKTQTHALLPASPALNAGGNAEAVGELGVPLAFDQREEGFDRVVDSVVDIGAFEAQWLSGSLTGVIWDDADANGTLGDGELPFDGVTVALYLDDGDGLFGPGQDDTFLVQTVTAGGGTYGFSGLKPGRYWVDPDTAAGPLTGRIVNHLAASDPLPVMLAEDQDRTDADIGFVLPSSIGGVVWNDADEDAELDADEGGIEGVTVNLYRDDGDGTFEPGGDDALERTQATTSEGFDFAGLVLGNFWVEVDESGAALDGATRTSASNVLAVSLPADVDCDTADVGYFRPIVVDTLVDEDDGDLSPNDLSLREALGLADLRAGVDAILFHPGLIGGSIMIEGGLSQLNILSDVDIRGPGAGALTINAMEQCRIFHVAGNTVVAISGLSLQRGHDEVVNNGGGGILIEPGASVVVQGVTFVDNSANRGGGIFSNQGTLTVRNCEFTRNSSENYGGGIESTKGLLTVIGCTFSRNEARLGGGVESGAGELAVRDSTFTGNYAVQGGAVYVTSSSLPATITDTTIVGNGLGLPDAEWSGGGVYVTNADVVIERCTLSNLNAGIDGGGVMGTNGARVTVIDSTISQNTARIGGGVVSGRLMMTIINSTISGNTATQKGGGIHHGGEDLTIVNSTIVGNEAATSASPNPDDHGGGINCLNDRVVLHNTILAGNLRHGAPEEVYGTLGAACSCNVVGHAESSGGLVDGVNGNIVGVADLSWLAPLADNGGPTKTHALLPSSPAINAGDNAMGAGLATDQRGQGFDRVCEGTVDIGAIEAQWLSGSLAGVVWNDEDVNGFLDGGEGGVDGATVRLYADDGDGVAEVDGDDALVATIITAGGAYEFRGLPAGTYWVDPDEMTGGLAGRIATTADPLRVDLPEDAELVGRDVGYIIPSSIGGTVWNDADEDAELDADEGGIEGVTVNLYRDDGDGTFEPGGDDALERTLVTAGGGLYDFTDLVTGSFWVEVDEAASATVLVDATPTTPGRLAVSLPADEDHDGENFGYFRPIVVDTLDDHNDGDYGPGALSIREAIAFAAARPGKDMVLFDPALTGGTILFSGPSDLVLSTDVDIRGPGANLLTIDADKKHRVFRVDSGANVTISGLTATNGYTSGDGLSEYGAGVRVEAGCTVVLSDVTVSNGSCGHRAGAGGVHSEGDLTILNSTITNNSGYNNSGGIRQAGTGSLTIAGSVISNNRSGEKGGGITCDWATVTITDSVISGNFGGSGAKGLGGGIHTLGHSHLVLRNSIISGNVSRNGGGIRWESTGNLTIDNCTFSGNSGVHGGALQNLDGAVTITNSTFSGNSCGEEGGAICSYGPLALINVTIADNRAGLQAGGVYVAQDQVVLHNTVVAGNVRSSDMALYDVQGTFDPASSHNLIGTIGTSVGLDGEGSVYGTDIEPLNPLLGPLADNYGPTQTHALLPFSPAIDRGSTAVAEAYGLAFDQRGAGFPRTVGAEADIGAYERGGAGGIGDLVWNDRNADGRQDAGEPGLEGVVVRLYSDDDDGVFEPGTEDELLDERTTLPDGAYAFSELGPAAYWVAVDETFGVLADGYQCTTGVSHEAVQLGTDEYHGGADFGYYRPIVVSTVEDEQDTNQAPGDLSLREALALANVAAGYDVIQIDAALDGETIHLDPGRGQLAITSDMRIEVLGGGRVTIDAAGRSRVVYVESGVRAHLIGLALTGGAAAEGAGVYKGDGSELTLERCEVSDNRSDHDGGGIFSKGTLVLIDTTVCRNLADTDGRGGGIHNFYGTVEARGVAIWGNAAEVGGGAYSTGSLVLSNTTVSGNESVADGGGVWSTGLLELTNVTVAANRADADGDGGGTGGGLRIESGFASLNNTIVAGNSLGRAGAGSDVAGALSGSGSHNLVGTGNGSQGLMDGLGGNQVGTDAARIDAGLYDLADYGGATWTHALRAGSRAVDAGSDASAAAAGLTVDQCGTDRFADGDADGTAAVDIGAFEAAAAIVVSSPADETDGEYGAGHLSLREALALAAAAPWFDVIRFAPVLFGGTIALSLGPLAVDGYVHVAGPGADRLVVDADSTGTVFQASPGAVALMSGLTITGGSAENGGGVRNDGILTAWGLAIVGNQATADGGGVYNAGTLVLRDSTLSSNTAGRGGGLAGTGTLTAANLTLSGNQASAEGGGMWLDTVSGAASVTNATIVLNAAGSGAGGIHGHAGTVAVHNTILAGNTRTGEPADAFGAFSSASSFNFLGAADGSTGLEAGEGTRCGTAGEPLDPQLGPLADHGGATLTHAPLPGSGIIDAGSNARAEQAGLVCDQRGRPRVREADDDGVAEVDIGAFEQQVMLNWAPTLTHVGELGGAVEGRAFRITYEELALAADAFDADGDPLAFRIAGLGGGQTLTKDDQPVSADPEAGTLLSPGEAVVWQPPTSVETTTVVQGVFSVLAWDGQAHSAGAVGVDIEVLSTGEPVNYALLFSGGRSASANFVRYYDNLRGLYETLTDVYGLDPHNIHVLYADGRDPAVDREDGTSSDMSFAANVSPGTKANLQATLTALDGAMDDNDHFLFWSFDHGAGSSNPTRTGEELLNGWGDYIADDELASWLAPIDVGHATYVFAQCFSGGMLDDLLVGGTLPDDRFGCASATHYEVSYDDSFATAFTEALSRGYRNTQDAYAYAFTHDPHAVDGEGPGGDRAYGVEHPWARGGSFDLFAFTETSNGPPTLLGLSPLKCGADEDELPVTYDRMIAAADAFDPDGDALVFRIEFVTNGALTTPDGAPVVEGVTELRYGQTLFWRRPSAADGVVEAFVVCLLDGDTPAGPATAVSVRVDSSPTLPRAENDEIAIRADSEDAWVDVLANDEGASPLRVERVGVALHGTASWVGGTVLYTPVKGFVGRDTFSYLLCDADGATDMASVTIVVTGGDPQPEPSYEATVLPPPPGWAGLPDDWDWETQRSDLPAWTRTRAVDISDDGFVAVRTERDPPADERALWYTGGTAAGYLWRTDVGQPYWEETAGFVTSNTVMLLRDTQVPMPNDNTGRTIFHGIGPTALAPGKALAGIEYKSPDNVSEPYPLNGVLWLNAGDQDQIEHSLDEDIIPQAITVAAEPAGSAEAIPLDENADILVAGYDDSLGLWGLPREAFLWGEDDEYIEGDYAGWGGDGASTFEAVNTHGHMAGWAEYDDVPGEGTIYHAAFHDGTSMIDLGVLPGWPQSFAWSLNDLDEVVGISGESPWTGQAFYWADGEMTSLGTLPNKAFSSALDINKYGVIVGTSGERAFVYAGGVMHDLCDLIGASCDLIEATAINNLGQIVATGLTADGIRAFYLDPVETDPPVVTGVLRNAGSGDRTVLTDLWYTFNEDVSLGRLGESLEIVDTDSGEALDLSAATMDWDPVTYAARWDFSAVSVPGGRYEARLDPRLICDRSMNPLDGDGDGEPCGEHVWAFVVAGPGDVTCDGFVDHFDYLTLKAHVGQDGAEWAQGDLDGDTDVDCEDVRRLESAFGEASPPAPAEAEGGAEAETTGPEPAAVAVGTEDQGTASAVGALSAAIQPSPSAPPPLPSATLAAPLPVAPGPVLTLPSSPATAPPAVPEAYTPAARPADTIPSRAPAPVALETDVTHALLLSSLTIPLLPAI